jgi:hypothetical protein
MEPEETFLRAKEIWDHFKTKNDSALMTLNVESHTDNLLPFI